MSEPLNLPPVDLSSEAPGGGIAATMLARLVGDLPPQLFHYTDAAGLIGIVSRECIWATDTRFLNDRTEFVHGRDICRSVLKSATGDRAFSSLCTRAATFFTGDDFRFFSASFCEEDDLVPQWRGYGSNGAGYALGMAVEPLTRLSEEFMLQRVRYDESDKRDAAEQLVEAFRSVWESTPFPDAAHRRAIGGALGTALLTGLTILAVSFKPAIFKHEREWRLVNVFERERLSASERLKFRDARGSLVPYVEFDLQNPSANVGIVPLASLRVGPTIQGEATEDAVELFLKSHGHNVAISRSAAPLRF